VAHVGVRPLPEPVELRLLVQLHGEHHAIGHALAADVVVADVRNVGHVCADGIVDALGPGIAGEEVGPSYVDLRIELGLGLAEQLAEEIAGLGRGRDRLGGDADGETQQKQEDGKKARADHDRL